jgi:hypothetical protein
MIKLKVPASVRLFLLDEGNFPLPHQDFLVPFIALFFSITLFSSCHTHTHTCTHTYTYICTYIFLIVYICQENVDFHKGKVLCLFCTNCPFNRLMNPLKIYIILYLLYMANRRWLTNISFYSHPPSYWLLMSSIVIIWNAILLWKHKPIQWNLS